MHYTIGGFAGLLALMAVRQIRGDLNVETDLLYGFLELGTYIGVALIGSHFPDFAEPADNPQHRGVIHSVYFFVFLLILLFVCSISLNLPPPPLLFARLSLTDLVSLAPHIILIRIAAHFIVAFLAGYASHLLLDKFF